MTRVIRTYRPLSKKKISWINAITRWIFGFPHDHIAWEKEGMVYESTIKTKDGESGVQIIPYSEWIVGREGTKCLVTMVPDDKFDWGLAKEMDDIKYDKRAAIFHFLQKIDKGGKWEERMKKRADEAVTCLEYFGVVVGMPDAYKATFKMVDAWIKSGNYQSFNETISK